MNIGPNPDTITAAEYGTWLMQTLTSLDDGPEFDRIEEQFDALVDTLLLLERCFHLPSYEAN